MENVLLSDASGKTGECVSCKINAIFFIHCFPMPQQRLHHTKKLQSVGPWIDVSFDVTLCNEQVVSHILVSQVAFDGCWSTEGFFNWIEERSL